MRGTLVKRDVHPIIVHAGAYKSGIEFYMRNGAAGVMFGRNMWLREFDHAVALSHAAHKILSKYPR